MVIRRRIGIWVDDGLAHCARSTIGDVPRIAPLFTVQSDTDLPLVRTKTLSPPGPAAVYTTLKSYLRPMGAVA